MPEIADKPFLFAARLGGALRRENAPNAPELGHVYPLNGHIIEHGLTTGVVGSEFYDEFDYLPKTKEGQFIDWKSGRSEIARRAILRSFSHAQFHDLVNSFSESLHENPERLRVKPVIGHFLRLLKVEVPSTQLVVVTDVMDEVAQVWSQNLSEVYDLPIAAVAGAQYERDATGRLTGEFEHLDKSEASETILRELGQDAFALTLAHYAEDRKLPSRSLMTINAPYKDENGERVMRVRADLATIDESDGGELIHASFGHGYLTDVPRSELSDKQNVFSEKLSRAFGIAQRRHRSHNR